MRALPIDVYRENSLGDCTNGGISSVYDRLLLLCEDGQVEIDPENPPENLVKIVERNLFGRIHKHIEPVARPEGAGWMYGGNIACTSDSRFNSDYPLKIHDRQESWELYESMSD
jgi:hypothetical protein